MSGAGKSPSKTNTAIDQIVLGRESGLIAIPCYTKNRKSIGSRRYLGMKKPSILITTLFMAAALSGAAGNGESWHFDHDRPGMIPKGFYGVTGSWKVRTVATAPSEPNVLAQLAKNPREAFNIALVAGSGYSNADISVKMRSIGGKEEQGGGVVWRVKDSRNYYVFRYNSLDGSLALYKVMNNGPVELAHTAIMNVPGWHTIRVVMTGDHIVCYFDGTKYLDRRDNTFANSGRIGLWTKADAQTYFDDMTVTGN